MARTSCAGVILGESTVRGERLYKLSECPCHRLVLIAEKIAPLYGVAVDAVTVINYPLGRAIKIVVPRQIMSGDPGDRDVYGAQQHTPLLRLEI